MVGLIFLQIKIQIILLLDYKKMKFNIYIYH